MNRRLKSALMFALDVVELYVPMLAFLTIFVCFMIQIISRYFFTPLMWPEELALLSFLWVALLGALYAKRHDSLVVFSMVYDALRPRGRTVMRLCGNVLLVAAFVISIKPTLDYVIFLGYKKSSVLFIPMNIVSSVYVVFLLFVTGRYVFDVVRDARSLASGGPR